jgi:hypothetical protein
MREQLPKAVIRYWDSKRATASVSLLGPQIAAVISASAISRKCVSQVTCSLDDLGDDQRSTSRVGLRKGMDSPMAMRTLLEGTAMQIIVGPVLTRKGGYAFDCWTPEEGLSPGYTYGRIEDAHYARKVEIRYGKKGDSDHTIACSTVDDFVRLTI